jgi:hypothetical protein
VPVEVSAAEATRVVRETVEPAGAPDAPTWSSIYARFFGPGTEGACGRSGACHRATMSDATSTYGWLAQRGYIDGGRSALVSPTNSCLRWFGGNMPPGGKPNDEAASVIVAWVAGGALPN